MAVKDGLQEARLIYASDLLWLLRGMKKRLFFLGAFGAIASLVLLAYKGASYEVEASFRERSEGSEGDKQSLMKQWLLSLPASGTQAQVFFHAHTVLRPVIETLGLQARVLPQNKIPFFLGRLWDLCCAECRLPLALPQTFRFAHVVYEGDRPIDVIFIFQDRERFDLFYQNQKIASGSVGVPLAIQKGELFLECTLQETPKAVKLHSPYTIRFSPWLSLVHKLRKSLAIQPSKTNPAVSYLTYKTRDRVQGAELVNALMAQFQLYVKREHDLFAKEQLAYLTKRQKELMEQFEGAIQERALSIDAECVDLSQQLKLFVQPYMKGKERSLAIDLELAALQAGGLAMETSPIFSSVCAMHSQIASLQQEWDLLSMKKEFTADLLCGSMPPMEESEALDWETVKSLYGETARKLDASQAEQTRLCSLLDQLHSPDRELGSFVEFLRDPVSQRLIDQGSALHRQLKEDKYCSLKEANRWREELALQRRLLCEHVKQLIQSEETQALLFKEKLDCLLSKGLCAIHRQLEAIEESRQDLIAKRKGELAQEKLVVEEHLQTLRSQLAPLPSLWQAEQLFDMQAKVQASIMETIVQLVETKTIAHHLYQVGSKPIDEAALPLLPVFPYAALILFCGALVPSGGCFLLRLIREAMRGFPLTVEKLRALKMPSLGLLSPTPEKTQIRRMALFAVEPPCARILGLVGHVEPEIAVALAKVFASGGQKVCLLHNRETPLQEEGICVFSYENAGFWLRPLATFDSLKPLYDVLIFYLPCSLDAPEAKVALGICDKMILSLREETIDLLTPFVSWAYDEAYCRLNFVVSTGR